MKKKISKHKLFRKITKLKKENKSLRSKVLKLKSHIGKYSETIIVLEAHIQGLSVELADFQSQSISNKGNL